MNRLLFKIIIYAAILTGVYFIAVKAQWIPSIKELFRPSPILIDESPLLLKEIKQINELVSITALDEVVVSTVKPAPLGSLRQLIRISSPLGGLSMQRIVLIVKGKIIAGTDLSKLNEGKVFIQEDSVSITLPKSIYLDIIVNPSTTETFLEEGEWTQAEVNALKQKAIDKLRERANQQGLLQKADAQSLRVMHDFLWALGYRRIRVVTE